MADALLEGAVWETLLETAAHWHERLAATPGDAALRAAFEAWRAADPAHAAAFAEIVAAHALARGAGETPAMLVLRHETLARLVVPRRSRSRLRPAIAAGLAAAMLGALTWQVLPPLPGTETIEPARPAAVIAAASGVYRTGVGERLTLTLADGSTAVLNTGSRLRTAYTAGERRLVLEQGQALFEVAKERGRPFVVSAGDQLIVAHGTAFDVRLARDEVKVALIEGQVTVKPRTAAKAQGVDLRPRELLVARGTATSVRRIENVEQVASWRDGILIFENNSLAEAAAEMSRYVPQRIEIVDPAVARIRISGAFHAGETDTFLEALDMHFQVTVVERTPERILLARRT